MLGHDLEARIAVIDLDRANLGLGDVAGAADQRQQPARLGVAVTPDIEAEPNHFARVLPRRAFFGMLPARFRLGFHSIAVRSFAIGATVEALPAVDSAAKAR